MRCLLRLNLSFLWIIAVLGQPKQYECDGNGLPRGCGPGNVATQASVIDGEDAVQHSWPMVVSVRFDCRSNGDSTTHCCDGTILSESVILTTSDCVDGLKKDPLLSNVTVAAGRHNRSDWGRWIRQVQSIVRHPTTIHQQWKVKHTIALLHLSTPIDLAGEHSLARTCLSSPSATGGSSSSVLSKTIEPLLAVGWDSDDSSSGHPHTANLQQMEVRLLDNGDPACVSSTHDAQEQLCIQFGRHRRSSPFYPDACNRM